MEGYTGKKLINSKSGLRIVSTKEEHQSPFVVQEPYWTPDKEISNCTKCGVKFGFTIRKHHCRRCGLIFCKRCCHKRLELPRMCFIDPVRVCLDCEPQTELENAFFDKHLKILVTGANFVLGSCESKIDLNNTILCKLSPDHRFLVFDGMKVAPIQLINISSLNISKESLTGGSSVTIDYSNGGEVKSICLDTNQGIQHSQALWINALQQAYQLLLQSLELK